MDMGDDVDSEDRAAAIDAALAAVSRAPARQLLLFSLLATRPRPFSLAIALNQPIRSRLLCHRCAVSRSLSCTTAQSGTYRAIYRVSGGGSLCRDGHLLAIRVTTSSCASRRISARSPEISPISRLHLDCISDVISTASPDISRYFPADAPGWRAMQQARAPARRPCSSHVGAGGTQATSTAVPGKATKTDPWNEYR